MVPTKAESATSNQQAAVRRFSTVTNATQKLSGRKLEYNSPDIGVVVAPEGFGMATGRAATRPCGRGPRTAQSRVDAR